MFRPGDYRIPVILALVVGGKLASLGPCLAMSASMRAKAAACVDLVFMTMSRVGCALSRNN